MCAAPQPAYRAPFDAVAHRYDETFTESLIGQAQRQAVWKELQKAFPANSRVLEVGCGTGVDACFVAEHGVRVVASDASAEMIQVATSRIQHRSLQRLVYPVLLPAENIASLRTNELFDGAFSNFGALNCVKDLRSFAKDLARLMKPGANVLLCWMGPACAWEVGWYLAKGNPQKAFRRWHRSGIRARVSDDAFVHVQYPGVGDVARAFAPEFRLRMVKGIGICVPPSYVEAFARRHPRLLKLAQKIDAVVAHCPGVRLLADHILVRLERTSAENASVEP